MPIRYLFDKRLVELGDELQDRIKVLLRRNWNRALVSIFVFLIACGDILAAPFVSNQNQYFAHALFHASADAESDWFRNTVDPYPVFTAVAKLTYNWAGIDGIRLLALFGTVTAIASVFMLARLLARQTSHSNTTLLSTLAVGLTLLPHTPHAFKGFAGQYVVSTPAYLQPSMFGCFLLLALPCLLAAQTTRTDIAKRLLAAAFILTALSCVLHPTYIASGVILLAAVLAANVWQRKEANFLYFACAAFVLIAIAVAANPSLISMAISSPEYDWAAQRFAFERIPHHTRVIDWGYEDVVRLAIAVIAIPIAAKKLDHPWLARFLAASLIIGAVATLAIQLAGQTKLALLFPWRASVFIMPISFTVIAVCVAQYAEQLAPHWKWRIVAFVLASSMALYGCIATFKTRSPAQTDAKTVLVREVRPSGVGLVPLGSDNVRLNAPANIYVDWESPPYASDDLIEWWHRIDQVRQFERDPEQFCSMKWHAPIRWLLLSATRTIPSCISRWKVAAQTDKWRVLEKD